jgi:hypothetical protein
MFTRVKSFFLLLSVGAIVLSTASHGSYKGSPCRVAGNDDGCDAVLKQQVTIFKQSKSVREAFFKLSSEKSSKHAKQIVDSTGAWGVISGSEDIQNIRDEYKEDNEVSDRHFSEDEAIDLLSRYISDAQIKAWENVKNPIVMHMACTCGLNRQRRAV